MEPPSYLNPEDKDTIAEITYEIEINSNPKNILSIANSYFPDWIVTENYNGLADEPSLKIINDNWSMICEQTKQPKRAIVLVTTVNLDPEDKNHTLLRMICDYLTKFGYYVRTVAELSECSRCKKVIFSRYIVENFFNGIFYGTCEDCIQSNKSKDLKTSS